LVHLTDEVNVLRKDALEQPISHQEAMKNAPGADTDYFRVPRR
jgi:aspartyl-tRNA(Asn)/glutamyl-tRNA(Gln) amidotransferase subunit C